MWTYRVSVTINQSYSSLNNLNSILKFNFHMTADHTWYFMQNTLSCLFCFKRIDTLSWLKRRWECTIFFSTSCCCITFIYVSKLKNHKKIAHGKQDNFLLCETKKHPPPPKGETTSIEYCNRFSFDAHLLEHV